ncbi:hypothetical protein NDU88_007289 [Pleurodeles waltl]|uniref:Uncharacterized protein n=1 Tax=Pleurodeles waltl TaxID=8319 RepID=A0AAV7N1U1_PLEWA|nr:hypothetical protein NDU88_007289 [Pleurodeles waltl]
MGDRCPVRRRSALPFIVGRAEHRPEAFRQEHKLRPRVTDRPTTERRASRSPAVRGVPPPALAAATTTGGGVEQPTPHPPAPTSRDRSPLGLGERRTGHRSGTQNRGEAWRRRRASFLIGPRGRTGKSAMPRGKTTGKASGKPARQLLFSEALRQQKHSPVVDPLTPLHTNITEDTQGASMYRILQEISAVGRKLEGMDNAMVALTAETRSMRLEIAGFQSQIPGLDQQVTTVEAQAASWTNRDQELLHLRSRLTDLEDRSHRNNIPLLGIMEGTEDTDTPSYLQDRLPKLTDTTFDPPLEFQRAHRLGPK